MYANAQAIVFVAKAVGNSTVASQFMAYANNLQAAMYQQLWNTTQEFFVDNIVYGYPASGQVSGREAVGFYPFRFGVGLQSQYIIPTLAALTDPQGFNTTYYPPTLEVRNQYYTSYKPSGGYCCFWQGQNWPFTTAHFHKSLAAIHRFNASAFSTDQFYAGIRNYAATQQKNNTPYIAESHYPTKNAWSQDDTPDHSPFYQHSTNNDNILADLLGIRPRSDNILEIAPIIPSNWTYFSVENLTYHGHLITILHDQNGSHYKQSKGLTVFLDGKNTYNSTGPSATFTLPASTATAAPLLDNVASNPIGQSNWPQAYATYTWGNDNPFEAIDGLILYDENPNNRWTNYDSNGAHKNDTLTIQLPRPCNVTALTLAVFSDVNQIPNGGVNIPARLEVTSETGTLLANVTTFVANDINIIPLTTSNPISLTTIHMNFFGRPGYAVGVTEAQLWVPAYLGPTFYAADAVVTDPVLGSTAGVVFDPANSKLTTTGAVVVTTTTSNVQFAGVYISAAGGMSVVPTLTYKNNGTSVVGVQVVVNKATLAQTLNLPVTGGSGYGKASLPSVQLSYGRNFFTVVGGDGNLFLESLVVGS